MKLLSISQYSIAIDAIKSIDINHLFALAVAEQKIDGRIFVDDTDHPTTFLVYHPYGMSMLFGDETNAGFNAGLLSYAINKDNSRTKTEWLQAYPSVWNVKLAELFDHNTIPNSEAKHWLYMPVLRLLTIVWKTDMSLSGLVGCKMSTPINWPLSLDLNRHFYCRIINW